MLNKLCLLWQDVSTRKWVHVGNLTLDSFGVYSFFYEKYSDKRGLDEASKHGYRLHPAFPEVDRVYTSKFLFSAFARRLPDRKRNDYSALLNELGIFENSTDFEMLSLTGGALNSDQYEFVKPIQFIENSEAFELDFFIRGWRYHGKSDKLTQQDHLVLEAEEGNTYDKDAVYVLKNNENKIGYVPAFYSNFIKAILVEKLDYELRFEFNEEAPSHYKVKVYMVGLANESISSQYREKIFSMT